MFSPTRNRRVPAVSKLGETELKMEKAEGLLGGKFLLQFFSIALAHFSIHCLLFQSSSHTALNRSWNDQNTIWCLQNDTTFSKLITHPSKPNISIKTYNLCSIENVCFLIYLTMDNKIQTTAININLWIHHFNFCATPSQYWLFYQWQHTTLWVLYWALLRREYTVRKYLKWKFVFSKIL